MIFSVMKTKFSALKFRAEIIVSDSYFILKHPILYGPMLFMVLIEREQAPWWGHLLRSIPFLMSGHLNFNFF